MFTFATVNMSVLLKNIGMWVVFSVLTLGATVFAQDANCDYYQQLSIGQTVSTYSQNYPMSYPGGITCRWTVTCPNANCRVVCNDINIPWTNQCSMDRLLISKSGDPQLNNADTYCGTGTTSADSLGNTVTLGLITSQSTTGGRFSCTITSVQATQPSCSCGYKKQNRIVGGVETGINEFPMMVGLVDTSQYSIFCGGVIIDKRYILTAAHCLNSVTNLNSIAVVVGEHDVTTGDSPATQVYRILDYLIHPQYNQNNQNYDAALIMVANDITFSDRVGPACLPFNFGSFAGARVTALGWGTLWFGGPPSNTLQKVDLDVLSNSACSSNGASVTQSQFCTYTPGKDACQLDSGGPLLYTDQGTGLLFNMGIISYGSFCATNRPAINTLVTSILNWIVSNTPDANYCRPGGLLRDVGETFNNTLTAV